MKTYFYEFDTIDKAKEFFAIKQLDGWKLLCDTFATEKGLVDSGEETTIEYVTKWGAVFYTS